MSLFIPRKQNIVGKSTQFDGPYLEKALRDNFLAIQRWANLQGAACQVSGGTQAVSGATFNIAVFDTVAFQSSMMATTSDSTITISDPGVWLFCMGGSFTDLKNPSHVDMQGLPGGAPPFFSQVTVGQDVTQETFAGLNATATRVVTSTELPVHVQSQMRVIGSTSASFALWEMSVVRLMDIPSAVQ